MKKNMGSTDKTVRAIIGIVALILALFVTDGAWDAVLYIIAVIMLVTAIVGVCPLYMLFGISTKK